MAVSLYATGTEYVANAITLLRGTTDDIVAVGVFHSLDPEEVPQVSDFTTVALVEPGDPLADGDHIDILSLIGPRDGDVQLTAGDWQRWTLITTATEDVIRKVDVITVTGAVTP